MKELLIVSRFYFFVGNLTTKALRSAYLFHSSISALEFTIGQDSSKKKPLFDLISKEPRASVSFLCCDLDSHGSDSVFSLVKRQELIHAQFASIRSLT